MLRITDIRLPIEHSEEDLRRSVVDILGIDDGDLLDLRICRKSTDARKKSRVVFVYTLDIQLKNEDSILESHSKNVAKSPEKKYMPETLGVVPAQGNSKRPVIVGAGPCGLFAALLLAQNGARPVLLERGKRAEQRAKDVARFWKSGELDPDSNVQFGEGGAGTFSDGKLTTQIKDRHNRCRKVLDELVEAGASEDILYKNKPHIGTDVLIKVVGALRQKIESLGGELRFESQVTDLMVEDGAVRGVALKGGEHVETDSVVLAIGHSARDTFEMLSEKGVAMEPKPFSIGARIEHAQDSIDCAQFGPCAGHPRLGAADYKLVHHSSTGRSVYTFCMCPGGRVIAAASEPGCVVTNGMSAYSRGGANANSALLVGVKPSDFASQDPLAGVEFQREWERRAYELGGKDYRAPAQLVGDFILSRASGTLGAIEPSYKPGVELCDLRGCLPDYVAGALKEAIPAFDRKLKGFAAPDAVLTGVETRTSSPVRIVRDDSYESISVKGLYPAGEGAGYAGGIVSAAVDGLKVAEVLLSKVT